MNNDKGEQVFGNDVDAVLADKIVEHTKKSSGRTTKSAGPARRPEKAAKPNAANFVYRTPEHRYRSKGLQKYGIAALALLVILGILSYFLKKFRDE
jgi:hypothetical protein